MTYRASSHYQLLLFSLSPMTPPSRNPALVAAAIIGGIVVAPIAAPPLLGLFGFSAIGPIAGTFAAVSQAGIGNVVAGSAFAGAQSVAAGGALPTVGYAVSGSLTGALAYIFG